MYQPRALTEKDKTSCEKALKEYQEKLIIKINP